MASIRGTRGDDQLTGTTGDDQIDGRDGRDTVSFGPDFFSYTIGVRELSGADSLTVLGSTAPSTNAPNPNATGRDQLENVEVLRFGQREVDVDGEITSQSGGGERAHGNGKGRGHDKDGDGFDDHANTRGRGHDQHGDSDGGSLRVDGVEHVNHTPVFQAERFSLLSDGSAMNTEVTAGEITTESAPDGEVALHLVTDSDAGRLRLNNLWDADQHVTLGELDQLSFDYYVDSSSRTNVTPVVRLIIDADGELATTGDRGELVFEYAYQGEGPVTQDSWQTADLFGDDWNAWQRSLLTNKDFFPNIQPLSNWADEDGFTPTGGIRFNEDSLVIGWSVALGSGNGTNDMYLDNLQVGDVTYDFV